MRQRPRPLTLIAKPLAKLAVRLVGAGRLFGGNFATGPVQIQVRREDVDFATELLRQGEDSA